MKLKTIRDAAALLDVSESRVRRAAKAGQVPAMLLGNRLLVDVDAARDVLIKPEGVKIEAVSEATGLTVTAIRRAVSEGWMPCSKPGKAYIFQLEEVKTAITKRMNEQMQQNEM